MLQPVGHGCFLSKAAQAHDGKIPGAMKLTPVIRWLPSLLLMALIFYVSSLPAADIPDLGWVDRLVKKTGHAVGYGLLSITYFYALPTQRGRPNRFTLAWLLTVAYGLTDEWHQSYVFSRNASLIDVGIDAAGAAIALWLLHQFYSNSSSSPSASSSSH